jgi:hypothetical protein
MPESAALLPISDAAALAILAGAGGAPGGMPLPYAREILLLSCHVAGTSHRELRPVEPELAPGEALVLRREPDNPHDARAIRVERAGGTALGYVPRRRNEVLANLLDAGKLLPARLIGKAWQGDWLRLEIEVLLRDW